MDRQQDVIRRITAHIVAYRFWRHNQIIDERREMRIMALELKGLKAKAMTARANIGKLDAAYDAFNAKAGNHVSDVESLAEQLGSMAEDLTFATTTLGNSVAGSNAGAAEKPKEQSAEKQVIAPADIGKIVAEFLEVAGDATVKGGPRVLPDGPAGVGDLNLPGPVGTRVALGPHPDRPEVEQHTAETFRAAE